LGAVGFRRCNGANTTAIVQKRKLTLLGSLDLLLFAGEEVGKQNLIARDTRRHRDGDRGQCDF